MKDKSMRTERRLLTCGILCVSLAAGCTGPSSNYGRGPSVAKAASGAWVATMFATDAQTKIYVSWDLRDPKRPIDSISNSEGLASIFLPCPGVVAVRFKNSAGDEFQCHGTLFFGISKDRTHIEWAFALDKNAVLPDWVENVGTHYRQVYPQNVFLLTPSFSDALDSKNLRLVLVGTENVKFEPILLPAFK